MAVTGHLLGAEQRHACGVFALGIDYPCCQGFKNNLGCVRLQLLQTIKVRLPAIKNIATFLLHLQICLHALFRGDFDFLLPFGVALSLLAPGLFGALDIAAASLYQCHLLTPCCDHMAQCIVRAIDGGRGHCRQGKTVQGKQRVVRARLRYPSAFGSVFDEFARYKQLPFGFFDAGGA